MIVRCPRFCVLGTAVVGLLLLTLNLNAAPPLLVSDFETGTQSWISIPAVARLSVVADNVHSGHRALALDYESDAKSPAVAFLPVAKSLAGAKLFSIWLMSPAPTAVAIVLNEKPPGGNYTAVTWLEPSTWQHIELSPDDFQLGTGTDDPKDPDGKLDLDRIRGIGILDISQIFTAFATPGQPIAMANRAGPHRLFIDDLAVSAETPSWYHPPDPTLLEDFSHPQVGWFTFGGADLTLDTSKTIMPGNALQVSYQQSEDRFAFFAHALVAADLTGTTHLTFDIASDKKASFAIALEMQSALPRGPRFSTTLEVNGGNKVEHREIALKLLELDKRGGGGNNDANIKLDLSKIKSISFVDFSGVFTHQTVVNTVRIGPIRAVTVQSPEDPSK